MVTSWNEWILTTYQRARLLICCKVCQCLNTETCNIIFHILLSIVYESSYKHKSHCGNLLRWRLSVEFSYAVHPLNALWKLYNVNIKNFKTTFNKSQYLHSVQTQQFDFVCTFLVTRFCGIRTQVKKLFFSEARFCELDLSTFWIFWPTPTEEEPV